MRLLLDCGRSLAGVSRSQVPILTFFQAYFRIFRLICSKAAKQQAAVASVATGSAKPSQAKPIELALFWLCFLSGFAEELFFMGFVSLLVFCSCFTVLRRTHFRSISHCTHNWRSPPEVSLSPVSFLRLIEHRAARIVIDLLFGYWAEGPK